MLNLRTVHPSAFLNIQIDRSLQTSWMFSLNEKLAFKASHHRFSEFRAPQFSANGRWALSCSCVLSTLGEIWMIGFHQVFISILLSLGII